MNGLRILGLGLRVSVSRCNFRLFRTLGSRASGLLEGSE